MADTKTSQLTQLAATPDVADLLMVVDVSDTTMAATGTNKRLPASYVARSDAGAKLITGNGRELTVPATGTAALADVASTFTVAPTAAQIKQASATIANNGTQQIAGTFGLLILGNATSGGQALMWLGGAGGATIINQVGTNISNAQGTAAKLNVYYSGGVFYLENKIGAPQTVYYLVISI